VSSSSTTTKMPPLPRRMKPHDRFFASLLSASASELASSNANEPLRLSLLSEMCGRVGLPPPSPLPATYRDAHHFYSSRASLVVEEARWAVAEALGKHRRFRPSCAPSRGGTLRAGTKHGGGSNEQRWTGPEMALRLVGVEENSKSRAVVITFVKGGSAKGEGAAEIAGGSFTTKELRDMRPGCCFEVVPPRPVAEGIVRADGGEIGADGGADGASVLAAVLPWRSKSSDGGGDGRARELSLMVFRPGWCHNLPRLLDDVGGVGEDEWKVRPLTTLISGVRQFEACTRMTEVPFLPKIMGWKDGAHTRFTYSDDEEDDEEEEEKKSEDIEDGGSDGWAANGDSERSTIPPADGGVGSCDPAVDSPIFDLPKLNPTQERAATTFLDSHSSSVTLVQGPPGTGKTTFLVSVLCRCILGDDASRDGPDFDGAAHHGHRRRRRVLVTAPTNKAVGVLASRFLDAMVDPDGVNAVLIGVEDKLFESENEEEGGGVGGGAGAHRGGSKSSLASSSSSAPLSALRRIFAYTWIDAVLDEVRSLREALKKSLDSSEGGGNAGRTLLSRARSLRRRLERSVPRLSADCGASGAAAELVRSLEVVGEGESRGGGGEEEIDRMFAIAEAREAAGSLLEQLKGADGSLATDELLWTADVIFCTLSTAGTSALKRAGKVDDLFVDEAAAATEPEMCVPFHASPDRMLAVGDPMQLPATILSKHAVACGLDRSLHERLMFGCSREHIMLNIQYRMRPDISTFPSRRFYSGKLTNGSNVERDVYKEGGAILGGAPYTFFDIKGAEKQSHSGSYFNSEEGAAVVKLVKTIRAARTRNGLPPSNGTWNSPERIRIITFYQGQVSLLRRLLSRNGLGGVLVATVDSSQGCEADVVIVSFVRSNKRGGDARRATGFLTDDRRMNVALTRAKYQMICVGDALGTLETAGGETIKALVRDAKSRGCISSARELDNID